MRVEVEQKFHLEQVGAVSRVRDTISALGGSWGESLQQTDSYFAHPVRDFSVTDEALRIRRQGDSCWITYKGPKLDSTTKTRQEIDTPLASSAAADEMTEMFTALSFSQVADVKKSRQIAHIVWHDRQVEVALDEVPPLGHFVELEIVTSQDSLDAARAAITSLAEELGLTQSERRSYLELLLQR